MYVSLTYPLNIVQHTLSQIVEHCKLESLTTPDNIVLSTVTSCWANNVCQFDLSLTFRMKQYSTSYTSHICYSKRFYNDFFLNHHTIALVNNCLNLLSCVVIETALDVMKRINYLNSLLSTRKRTILTSSRTVLNAMIAMHVHRQL